jgi:hypothetical protein
MIALRILGTVLVGLGAAMAAFPGWFGPLTGGAEPAVDAFQAVERHVRGGLVFGVGLLLMTRTVLRPWGDTIAWGLLYVILGYLLARLLGLVIEGPDPKQWLYIAVEAALMALPALWLWRSSGAA